jgi:hypothetical protein
MAEWSIYVLSSGKLEKQVNVEHTLISFTFLVFLFLVIYFVHVYYISGQFQLSPYSWHLTSGKQCLQNKKKVYWFSKINYIERFQSGSSLPNSISLIRNSGKSS